MQLIMEVNHQKLVNCPNDFDRDDDQQVIPQEGNIGVRSSLADYNSSRNGCPEMYQKLSNGEKKTRAQAVPMA